MKNWNGRKLIRLVPLDYDKFCSQILDAEPKIRFATVYDEWANKIGGGMRDGVENLLSPHAENELVNICTLDWKARKDMSKWLGKTKFIQPNRRVEY